MNYEMRIKRSTILAFVCGASLATTATVLIRTAPPAQAQARPPEFSRTVSSNAGENLPGLKELDEIMADLAEFAAPAVVHITSENSGTKSDDFGRRIGAMAGQGSGVVFRPDGYIITNDHVVGGFEKVTVILHDGREFIGKVIRADDLDIAVVKIEANDLPTLRFGDSSKVRPAQLSMAIGSPFDLRGTVTVGHISALGRARVITDAASQRERDYPELIQTDTSINMGNSGGPLINIAGEVIGINSAIFSPNGLNNGVGFAIPSNTARLVADKLIKDGKIQRGALGILPVTLKEYQRKELGIAGGAVIFNVENGTPADKAGLKKDDIITKIGSVPIKSETDVRTAMLSYAPGSTIPVEVIRGEKPQTFQVTLTSLDKLASRQPRNRPQINRDTPFGDGSDIDEFRRRFEEQLHEEPPTKEGAPRLGVTVEDLNPELRKQFFVPDSVSGAVVSSVVPGSVAERFGLRIGDVIQELGGRRINSSSDVAEAMYGKKLGDRTRIKSTRYGKGTQATQEREITFN